MRRKYLWFFIAAYGFLAPAVVAGLQVEEENKSRRPEYIEELQELAKLKDQGIITEEEFQTKKAQLLELDPPKAAAPKSDIMTAEAIIHKHCSEILIASMKSPSSTETVSISFIDSIALPRPLHRNVLEGQDPKAPGKTVVIEYDSANSYGAMLRGTIACDYTEPFVSKDHLEVSLRSLFINDEMVSKAEAEWLSIK